MTFQSCKSTVQPQIKGKSEGSIPWICIIESSDVAFMGGIDYACRFCGGSNDFKKIERFYLKISISLV